MRHAERPFRVDAARLRRGDDPPGYGDHGRKASIRFFRDRAGFWNPGDSFAATEELLDPTEKEVRNTAIVAALRRIGLSEQAGTGVRAILQGWQRLAHVPPVIEDDKAKKTFGLVLLRDERFSREQRLLQAQLGMKLSEPQARLFAFACRQRGACLADAKAVTGHPGPEARKVRDALAVQGLLEPSGDSGRYGLAEHIKGSLDAAQPGQSTSDQVPEGAEGLVSDQPGRPDAHLVTAALTNLTDDRRRIMTLCEVPRTQAELMREIGLSHRTFFRRKRLAPLLRAGLIRLTRPDEPNHPDQAYVVTETGLAFLHEWRTDVGRGGDP